jgi:hypothetical protein
MVFESFTLIYDFINKCKEICISDSTDIIPADKLDEYDSAHRESIQNEYTLKLTRKFNETNLLNKMNTYYDLINTTSLVSEYKMEMKNIGEIIARCKKTQSYSDILKEYEEKFNNLGKVLKMEEGRLAKLKTIAKDKEFLLESDKVLSLNTEVIFGGRLRIM